ncbi:MAG: hypothetical protein KAW91_01715, partial [candidate division Zixibacteria bacterium]|nr:hypothetical protein [candidate division Zixibacteria bacterium]
VQDGFGDEDSVVAIEYIQVGTSGYTDVVAQIAMGPGGSIPGNDLWYRFAWINLGTIEAQTCVLKMLLPDDMILDGLKDSLGYVMSPGDYSWVGDTIVVPLQTIQPSNVWRHVIPFGTLSPSAGGDIVAEMWLSGSTPDIDTLNNYAHHLLPVSDPGGKARSYGRSDGYFGDKTAHPNTTNRVYATSSESKPVEYLSYTITFENSPNANLDISSITVTDYLDDHLGMSQHDLNVWGNSHPQACQYAGIDPLTRVMTWNCIKINLQPGDKGSFQYQAAVKDIADGMWVLNTAHIGFGFDDPISAPGEGPVIRILGECCIPPIRGDINYDDAVLIDISDLVYLVDFMFNLGPEPICFEEGDIDGSGSPPIDISDLVYLTDYMFNSGPEPLSCP